MKGVEKVKICQIMAGTGKGGLEKHTFELSNNLVNKGYKVSVIANAEHKNEFDTRIEFIPINLKKSRNNIFSLYKLYKTLKEREFDIVHTQANKATSMITKIKPFINSSFIATLHNIKSNLKPFEKVDHVVTVSNKIGEKLKTKNKSTIYNGIKFSQVEYKANLYDRYNIDKEKFVICSVARLTKVKRFDILLKAIKSIKNIHLILVGSGKEEHELKNLAKELNIEDKITFTGALENHEAKEVINLSFLFVMTSDNEGFPYTFVESMFCNTPFLSTPVSDVKEFISDKYIIPFNNDLECSKKIDFIVKNYDEVKSDFNSIFDECQKKLTVENMVNETELVYKNNIKGKV